MILPEETATVLDNFMDWLRCSKSLADIRLGDLDKLFPFSDKYDIPQLRKDYVDETLTRNTQVKPPKSTDAKATNQTREHIGKMYAQTMPGSSLRKLLVDFLVFQVSMSQLSKDINLQQWLVTQPEFATDLLVAMAKKDYGKKNPFVHGTVADYYDAGILEWESRTTAKD